MLSGRCSMQQRNFLSPSFSSLFLPVTLFQPIDYSDGLCLPHCVTSRSHAVWRVVITIFIRHQLSQSFEQNIRSLRYCLQITFKDLPRLHLNIYRYLYLLIGYVDNLAFFNEHKAAYTVILLPHPSKQPCEVVQG